MGFERVSGTPAESDWKTSGGSLGAGTPASEGAQALGIANIGWALLESAPLSALGAISSSVKVDVTVPGTGTVPWGDVQLFVESPQLSLFNQPVGQVVLGGKSAGVYQTLEFPLAGELSSKLSQSSYSDLIVRIAINVPQTSSSVLVDHLTFGDSGGTGGNGGGGSSSSSGGSGNGAVSGGGAGGSAVGGTGASSSGGGGSGGGSGSGTSAGAGGSPGTGGADIGPCTFGPANTGTVVPIAFTIKLPGGVPRGEVVLGATGGFVQANDGVRLLRPSGSRATLTSTNATNDSRLGVEGEALHVFSDRGVVLANRAHVFGSVFAGTDIAAQADSVVDGQQRSLYDATPFRSISWEVPFRSQNRGNCALEPTAAQQLSPAAYGHLLVKQSARLRLTPGTYFFESLAVEPDATLELANTDGLNVYVRGGFSFKGHVEEAQDLGNVLFGVAGTEGAFIGAAFRGVVVAPNGPVEVASSTTGHVGQFFGKVVTAHQHTNITLRPFSSGSACGAQSSCGSFCPCTTGDTCETAADCADGLVCPVGNGPHHGRARGTSVCEPSDCSFHRRDLGCGFPGAPCGLSCDDGIGCTGDSDCPAGEICAVGKGELAESAAPNVCLPASCLDAPEATGCGSTVDLCGKCACTSTCSTKQCGDSPVDACGTRCRSFCGPREAGCTADADCQQGYACIVGGGPRIGLGVGVNVCLPQACVSPNPKQDCGQVSSPCGVCPAPADVCVGRSCGVDPAYGVSCGPAQPTGSSCVQGATVAALEPGELEVETTNRSSGAPISIAPLPVIEPATESAPGALDGTFAVSERGTATYTVPIAVPPGRNGIEPELSLRYSGGQSNGVAGVGWSVGGLSSIARCPKISALDDWAIPVQYDETDVFCIDGQRLLTVSGQYGSIGSVYRTELGAVDKVSFLAGGSDGQPYFEVRKKDGRIFRYGYSANSRIYRDIAERMVRVWALSRMEDRVGNYVSFEYGKFESAEARNLTDVKGEPIVNVENQTVELFLKSAAYGGLDSPLTQVVPRRLVELEYDPYRPDYMDGATRGGARVARTQLLTKITTSVGGAKVRSYELGYGGVGIPGPLSEFISPSVRTRRLERVTECSYKHGNRVCKRPTTFHYAEEHAIEETPQVTAFPQLKPELPPRVVVKLDWNGDGREDLLVQKSVPLNDPARQVVWTLLVATGKRTGPAFVEVPIGLLAGPTLVEGGCINQNSIVDINQDGNDDIIDLCGSERFRSQWWSTSDPAAPFRMIRGWDTPLAFSTRALLADVNADGFMDLFTCADDNRARVQLGTRNSVEHSFVGVIFPEDNWGQCFDFDRQTPDDPLMVQDIDGDGYGEILMYRKPPRPSPDQSLVTDSLWARYVINDQGAKWQRIWLPLTERAYSNGGYRFVDVNGDGLKDLIFLDIDQSATPLLSLNWGGVFAAPRSLYTGWDDGSNRYGVFPTLDSLRSALPIDFDGDGAQDVIRRFDQQAAGAPLEARSLWQWDRAEHQATKYTALWGDPMSAFANGQYRFVPQPGVTPPSPGFDVPALLADVDADGSPDLVQMDPLGTIYVHHGRFGRESLLDAVTDGLGKRLEIRYDAERTGAGGSPERVYTPTPVCHDLEQTPRTRCLNNPGPLVSEYQILFDAGDENFRVDRKTRLSYEDAREGLWGRGFYAFARQVSEELTGDGALIQRTEVFRDARPLVVLENHLLPFAGRETRRIVTTAQAQSSIEQQASFGRIERVNTWRHKPSSLGGIIPYIQETEEKIQDVASGGALSVIEATVFNDVDGYGNLVSSSRDTRVNGNLVSSAAVLSPFATDSSHLSSWLVSLPQRRSVNERVYDERSEEPYVARTVEYAFDELGLLTQVIREPDEDATSNLRQVISYSRSPSDPFRRVQSVTQSGSWIDNGDVISGQRVSLLEYDPEVIFPTRTIRTVGCQPDGSACRQLVTDVRFDPRDGTLLGAVDAAGVGSQAAYDSFGRLLKEVRASGTTSIEYADASQSVVNGRLVPAKLRMTTRNLATGQAATRRLDALGRTVQLDTTGLDQPSLQQELEYAWGGLVKYASRPHLPGDATQGGTTQEYDARWRVSRRNFPDGTHVEQARGSAANLSVDTEAREVYAVAQKDARGNVSYSFTDFRGNRLRTVDELDHETRFRYDPFDTLAMVADYRAHLTQLRVDRLGRLLEHEDADTGVQVYRYTAFDQVLTLTEGDGSAARERHHTYDELGRLTSLVAPEGTTAFSFDGPGDNAEGRLVETTSPSGTTEHFEYEARPGDGDPMKNRGFVEHVSRLIDGTTFTTTLSYDPASSQLSRVAYPSSAIGEPFAIHYQYDTFGNLKAVTSTSADRTNEEASIWQLNEAYQGQRIKKETFGNGVSTAYGYEDATGRLTSLTTNGSGGATLQDVRYTLYDPNGNLKARTSTLRRVGSSATDTYTETFNYDALDRLDDYLTNGVQSDLQYDEIGNITFKTGVGSYDYLEDGKPYRPHAVAGILRNGGKVADYRYDDFGNLSHRSGEGVLGGTQDLEYNSFNKPTKVTLGAGASQVQYEYDANQQRVLLKVGNCDTDTDPTCDKRVYVGGNYERQTSTEAGVRVTRHHYKIFAGARQVAQIDREQQQGAMVETRRFIHGDHLGSSQLITDESGELTQVQRLDPFGAPADSGSAPDAASARIRAGFTGHETDSETGLVNMGGRLYDARIGRVLQADPPFMESPFWSQGLNRYSYVFNNPLNATDPSGYLGDEPDESMEEMLERFKEYDREIEERNGSSGDDDGAGIDKDSINDANDDEAETSPGQGDPSDESVVGDAAESLDTDDHLPVPQIPTALDWAGGFGLGYAQGVVPGGTFLPMPPGSEGYQLSVAVGQLAGSVYDIIAGSGLAVGGGALTVTVLGAPVGVPAVAVGGGLAVAGGVNAANAIGNIVKIGDDPDQSPPGAARGGEPKVSSAGKMQKEVERGQAPRDIDSVHRGHVPGQEPHVHYKNGTSSTQRGGVHDAHRGQPEPSKEATEWLRSHGWTPPTQ